MALNYQLQDSPLFEIFVLICGNKYWLGTKIFYQDDIFYACGQVVDFVT